MVKTIFYFCPTEEEYNGLKDNAELSARTIVFVENTRAIYLNGKRYGQGAGYVTDEEFETEKESTTLRFTTVGVQLDQTKTQMQNELNETRIQLEDVVDALQASVADVRGDISQVSDDLDEFEEAIREEVEQDITDAVTDSDGKNVWTRISEADNGIQRIYNKVAEITDEDGNIKYTEALQNVISTGIANDESFSELQNRWAVTDENENVLKWMAAGFTSVAQDGQSFASVFATLVDDSMPGYKSAISNLRTRVVELENADYVATADLQTQVESLLGTTLSSLALKSDVTESSATLSSRIDSVSQWEDDLNERLAAVTTKANDNETLVTSLATFGEDGTSITYNKAAFDEAVAGLFVQGSGYDSAGNVQNIATACINAQVKGDQSWITLSADQINLDGNVIAQRLTTANASIGGWTIENNDLRCEIEDEDLEDVRTIRLDSTTPKITVEKGDLLGQTTVTEIDSTGLHTITHNPRQGSTRTNDIKSDGSGYLGKGGISWDTNGNFSISTQLAATTLSALRAGTDENNPLNGTSMTQSGVYIYSTEAEASSTVRCDTTIDSNSIDIVDRDRNFEVKVGDCGSGNDPGIDITGGDIRTDGSILSDKVDTSEMTTNELYIMYNGVKYELNIQAAITAGILTQVIE